MIPIEYDVQIHIVSRITDLAGDDFAEKGVYTASELFYPKPLEEDEQVETIDYYSDGTMQMQDGFTSLIYTEREDMGFEDAVTTVFFDPALPEMITVVRSGDSSNVMRFDPAQKRQMVSYNGAVPLEFAMTTREVVNTLTEEGGQIRLDYLLEMHGIRMQRNELTLTVRVLGPAEEEDEA